MTRSAAPPDVALRWRLRTRSLASSAVGAAHFARCLPALAGDKYLLIFITPHDRVTTPLVFRPCVRWWIVYHRATATTEMPLGLPASARSSSRRAPSPRPSAPARRAARRPRRPRSTTPTKRARAPATRRYAARRRRRAPGCASEPSRAPHVDALAAGLRPPPANRGLRRADASASPRNDRPAICAARPRRPRPSEPPSADALPGQHVDLMAATARAPLLRMQIERRAPGLANPWPAPGQARVVRCRRRHVMAHEKTNEDIALALGRRAAAASRARRRRRRRA